MTRTIEKATYTARTTIAYARERRAGATSMLVTFPKLKRGAARPRVGLAAMLDGIPAHRLYLGADAYSYIGPKRKLDGLHTAVDLIRAEARNAGVPPEDVVCVGTSMGAVSALMAGLVYGAGRIVVGGVPVKMGTALTVYSPAMAPTFVELARTPDGEDPLTFLDRFIFDLAAECRSRCRIDLLVSRGDYAEPSVNEFAEAASANPAIEVEVHRGAYGKHGAVGRDFFAFLHELLAAEMGRAPAGGGSSRS